MPPLLPARLRRLQSCYGVPELPDQGDMWLCRACELKEEGKPAPQCCLCPVAGGALKPTTIPGLWCHAACLQWIPEVGRWRRESFLTADVGRGGVQGHMSGGSSG